MSSKSGGVREGTSVVIEAGNLAKRYLNKLCYKTVASLFNSEHGINQNISVAPNFDMTEMPKKPEAEERKIMYNAGASSCC